MASGANKIPYLGCKISLISNAEIRYEGILYTVDVKDSTLALAKVVSFGTEDRPTDKPVPYRSEVYDYIIFRATDIKDVRVCESPKARSSSIEADPAIVKLSDPVSNPLGYPFPPGNLRPPPAAAGPFGSFGSLPPGYPVSLFDVLSGNRPGQQRHQQDRHQQQHERRQRAQQQPRRRTTSSNSQNEQLPQRQPRASQPPRNRRRGSFNQGQVQRHDGQQRHDHDRHDGRQDGHDNRNQHQQQHQRGQQHQQRGRGGRGRGRGRGGWGRGGHGGFWGRPRSSSRPEINPQPSETPDFDFDAAEQQFQKLFSSMKLGKKLDEVKVEEVEAPTMFVVDRNLSPMKYDKKASFFDQSSEPVTDEPQPRVDWRRERKMNAETFGQADVRRARFFMPRIRGGYRFNRGAHSGIPPAGIRSSNPDASSPTKSPTVLLNPVKSLPVVPESTAATVP